MIITKMGGSYLQAIFNIIQRDYETGKIVSVTERIFGADEIELWDRIYFRFPNKRRQYKPWRNNDQRR